jgi:protein-tyrosine phosphatase
VPIGTVPAAPRTTTQDKIMNKLLKFARKGAHILNHRLRTQGVRVTLLWVFSRGYSKLTGVPILAHSRITPEIYVGGQFGRRGKRRLEQAGISGDVNLRREFDDAAHGLALARYCHLPTVDDAAPTTDHLEKGVAFIRQVVDDGGKVYIHCAGGVGRAPTMAAAYFISRGMALDEALRLIRQTRPFINIMPPQMDLLRQFEQKTRNTP